MVARVTGGIRPCFISQGAFIWIGLNTNGRVAVRGVWLALNQTRGVEGSRPESTRLRRFCHMGPLLRSSQTSEAHMRDHGDGLGSAGFTEAEDDSATALGNREITPPYFGTRISGAWLAWRRLPRFHPRHRERCQCIQTHALDWTRV